MGIYYTYVEALTVDYLLELFYCRGPTKVLRESVLFSKLKILLKIFKTVLTSGYVRGIICNVR